MGVRPSAADHAPRRTVCAPMPYAYGLCALSGERKICWKYGAVENRHFPLRTAPSTLQRYEKNGCRETSCCPLLSTIPFQCRLPQGLCPTEAPILAVRPSPICWGSAVCTPLRNHLNISLFYPPRPNYTSIILPQTKYLHSEYQQLHNTTTNSTQPSVLPIQEKCVTLHLELHP